jgi:hypothetical protein
VWGAVAEWQAGTWTRARSDIMFAGIESLRAGEAWAFGTFTAAGDTAIAKVDQDGWSAVATTSLGKGRVEALSIAADACAWALGHRPDGSLLIARFAAQVWQALVLPEMDDMRTVAALSCDEAWFGGAAIMHYRAGAWQRLELPPETRVQSLASCTEGAVFAAGAAKKASSPTLASDGAMFEIRGGSVSPIGVEVPPGVSSWDLRAVGCNRDAVWAIARDGLSDPTRATLPLLFQLDHDVLRQRAWTHSHWEYYLKVLFR